jgi:hypothetical protein
MPGCAVTVRSWEKSKSADETACATNASGLNGAAGGFACLGRLRSIFSQLLTVAA